MDSNLTRMWVNFFTAAGIPSEVSATYALTFTENRIQSNMLLDLNKEYLRDMGITRMGDVIAILKHAKSVHECTARDRVLGSAVPVAKVPVAAVTGRTTIASPSSPASRILEHYTRNTAQESAPAPPPLKRKHDTCTATATGSQTKQSRLIRFGAAPPETKTEVASSKPTVFARLGASDAPKSVVTVNTAQVQNKPKVKAVFARLGKKSADGQDIPVSKDALRYEGILKPQTVVKKIVTVTTGPGSRTIAMGCTMRADEAPVSVKDKLDLPKAKSVKFSNCVEYKEIDVVKKAPVKPKFTTVFNKPGRRLCMPDVEDKPRSKSCNNLTITSNVFKRLGV